MADEPVFVDASTIKPSLERVADEIPSRTRGPRGVLQGTFNAETEPNAETAQRIIEESARYVASAVGAIKTTWPDWIETAKDAVALEAAHRIERRAPERSDPSLLIDLRESAKAALAALVNLGQEDQPGVGVFHAAELVSPFSGDEADDSIYRVLD